MYVLPQLIQEHLIDTKELTLDRLTETVYQLERSPEVSRERNLDELATKAIVTYLKFRLAKHYRRISPAVFELKRHLKIKCLSHKEAEILEENTPYEKLDWLKAKDGTFTGWVDIPLLARYSGGTKFVRIARFNGPNSRYLEQSIYAEFPLSIGSKEKQFESEALAVLCENIVPILGNNVLSPYVRGKMSVSYQNIFSNNLSAYWIPLFEHLFIRGEISVPPGDPALVFEYYGDRFLLKLWETPEENPIKHLFDEFAI